MNEEGNLDEKGQLQTGTGTGKRTKQLSGLTLATLLYILIILFASFPAKTF